MAAKYHQDYVTQWFTNQENYPFYVNPQSWRTSLITGYDLLRQTDRNSSRDLSGRLVRRENPYDYEKFIWTKTPTITNTPVSLIHSDWADVVWYPADFDVKRQAIGKWYKKVADLRVSLAVSALEAGKTADMLYAMSYRLGGAFRALRKGFVWEAFREFQRAQSAWRSSFRKVVKQTTVSPRDAARLALHKNSLDNVRARRAHARRSFRFNAPIIEIPLGIKPGRRYDNWETIWLEYAYGWVPLYNDIEGSMKALVDTWPSTSTKLVRTTVRGGMIRSDDLDDVGWSGRDDSQYKSITRGDYRSQCTVKGVLQIENDLVRALGTVGLTNPALVAWELVPFSFVVDWFLPIGDWLEAQTALMGLSIKEVSVTTTHVWDLTVTTTVNRPNWSPPYLPVDCVQVGKMDVYRKTKVRTLGLPAIPSLEFGNPFPDWRKTLSSLALIGQAFKTNMTEITRSFRV